MQETQETRVQSQGQEDPWRRAWQPTPVFLPGEFAGQRNLMGYSPWGFEELDTTEVMRALTHIEARSRQEEVPPQAFRGSVACQQLDLNF